VVAASGFLLHVASEEEEKEGKGEFIDCL